MSILTRVQNIMTEWLVPGAFDSLKSSEPNPAPLVLNPSPTDKITGTIYSRNTSGFSIGGDGTLGGVGKLYEYNHSCPGVSIKSPTVFDVAVDVEFTTEYDDVIKVYWPYLAWIGEGEGNNYLVMFVKPSNAVSPVGSTLKIRANLEAYEQAFVDTDISLLLLSKVQLRVKREILWDAVNNVFVKVLRFGYLNGSTWTLVGAFVEKPNQASSALLSLRSGKTYDLNPLAFRTFDSPNIHWNPLFGNFRIEFGCAVTNGMSPLNGVARFTNFRWESTVFPYAVP